jgi:hypothetical protein
MLNRGGCLGIARRAAHAGTTFAVMAATGGGLVALWPALPASAAGSTDQVTVTSSLGPSSTYGEKITFTAAVTTGGAGTPTGLVTFSYTNSFNGATVFNPTCTESASSTVSLDVGGSASCTPTQALRGGNDTVTAAYAGDPTFASNSGSVAQNVNPQTTTTAVVDNGPKPTTYGQARGFTATVTAQPTANPQATVLPLGGTVNFNAPNNATILPDCTNVAIPNGTTAATCSTKDLPVSTSSVTPSVTAFYNSDGNYQNSLSPAVSPAPTVNKASTTVSTPTSTSNPAKVNQSVIFTTTLTPASTGPSLPTGTVSFSDNGAAISGCSGGSAPQVMGSPLQASCTTSFSSAGPHSITAVYNGDANYNASLASSALSQTVVVNGSTTTLAAAPNPSSYGQTVMFTATVSGSSVPPTGSVTFAAGGNTLCTSSLATVGGKTTATCSTSVLPVGTDQVTASYPGDSTYGASQGQLNQTVNKASTTTGVTASPNPSNVGQQVTYTATVTPASTGPSLPTGTASFSDNGAAISACSGGNAPHVTGSPLQASCTTSYGSVGSHSITALYNGDANYNVSPASSALSQTVVANGSTVTIAAAPNPSTYGQTVTFTATVSGSAGPPTGTVTFAAGGNTLCSTRPLSTASGTTTATCSTNLLPVGTNQVVMASYLGDTNYAASQGQVNQTVTKAPTTVSTPVSSSNPVPLNQPVAYTTAIIPASAGPSAPTGTVTFSDNGSAIAACSGANAPHVVNNQATCTLPAGYGSDGQHSISAVYNGDSNYTPSVSQAMSQDVALPGYQMVAADGGLFSFGPLANFYGSEGAAHLNAPIVGMARDSATGGYWLVGADGGVFSFHAPFYGSMGSTHLNKPIVGIVAAPGGSGYWLVASDGGVFAFGPGAHFYGSMGSVNLNKPIVGIASAPGGNGYWLVGSDGGVFAFGPSATFYGSEGAAHLNQPVVGIAAAPGGNGYWLVASDGGVFAFGPGAHFYGSMGSAHLNKPIVGIAVASGGNGYWLVGSDGGVFSFGPTAAFYGSMGATPLNAPVVGIAGVG